MQQAGSLAEIRVRKSTETIAQKLSKPGGSSHGVGTDLGEIEPKENRGSVVGLRHGTRTGTAK